MPVFPPRNAPVKKKEQLYQRLQELQHAIRNDFAPDKLNKAVEKYRLAQLSLLKAKIHEYQERLFKKKPQLNSLETIENEILVWSSKEVAEIIREIQSELRRI